MDSGVFVQSLVDGRVTTVLDDNESESSSLGSSILLDDHLLQTPVRIHADSLESLNMGDGGDDKGEEMLVFKNTNGLQNDLSSILDIPELCDVEFLVGRDKVPVYGVKAIIWARDSAFLQRITSNTVTSTKGKETTRRKRWMSHLKNLGKSKRQLSSSSNRLRIPVEEFEPGVFRPLIMYLHCGSLEVSCNSVVGIMNAADCYGLEQVRDVCFQFAESLITKKSVLSLLASAEEYSRFKMSKLLMLEIMEFLTEYAQDILQSPDFRFLSKQTVFSVVSRKELRATEETKWRAVLSWSRQHCQSNESRSLRKLVKEFLPYLDITAVPFTTLEDDIRSLDVVPEEVIDAARYQQMSSRFVIGQEAGVQLHRRTYRRRSAKEISHFLRRKYTPVCRFSPTCCDSGIESA